MNACVPSRAVFGVLAATLLAALPVGMANAEDASSWQRDAHSAVRLLAGSRSGSVLLGGIAIQLAPGWKTYWRVPGDSGVPPRFDFSKSDNVESVTVLWPAPMKFDDGAGGFSLGYKKQVVLPLRIVAKNNDKPVTLRAHISYAVCDKLCIPAEATSELTFASVASTEDGNLAAALDAVPKPANIGDTLPLTIREIRREGDRNVVVDVSAPEKKEVGLFVEGPTADWALPIPKLLENGPPGVKRFVFELDGLPPNAKADGAMLKFTLVSGERAYEFNANLN